MSTVPEALSLDSRPALPVPVALRTIILHFLPERYLVEDEPGLHIRARVLQNGSHQNTLVPTGRCLPGDAKPKTTISAHQCGDDE